MKVSILLIFGMLIAGEAHAQAVGGPEQGRPVRGDPGISSMMVIDNPAFRVLRDWAEPSATRRMHSHANTTYQVFTLVTGELRFTAEGEEPVEVHQGEVLYLDGGVRHTFTNIGDVTATIVEVFGKPAVASEGAHAPARGLAAASTRRVRP